MAETEGRAPGLEGKKRRLADGGEEAAQQPEGKEAQAERSSFNLNSFSVEKILRESAREKLVFIHGKVGQDCGEAQDAVVILEKTPFCEETLPQLLNKDADLRLQMKNDIYSTHHLYPLPSFNEIKTTVVYPATEKHIKKYLKQEMYLITETADDYKTITSPYLQSQALSLQVDDLYLIAICKRHGVKSVRDLTAEHLPMLQNILKEGQVAISKQYNIPGSQLRIYFHYQPSYYHLHIHFTALGYDAPGTTVERAHLLSSVIENLQTNPEYYQKRTLTFALKADDPLLQKFKEAGRV
ncbi:m7GpppX diphosphatase isoform X2 [Mustelus asterias]